MWEVVWCGDRPKSSVTRDFDPRGLPSGAGLLAVGAVWAIGVPRRGGSDR